ncbi:MAG: hypothetical protein ABI833_00065 [Acidobacteriota bacterium]
MNPVTKKLNSAGFVRLEVFTDGLQPGRNNKLAIVRLFRWRSVGAIVEIVGERLPGVAKTTGRDVSHQLPLLLLARNVLPKHAALGAATIRWLHAALAFFDRLAGPPRAFFGDSVADVADKLRFGAGPSPNTA